MMLEGLYSNGVNKGALKRAVNRRLDKKAKTGFQQSRENRVKTLINSISAHISSPKNVHLTRYELLEKVMDKHGYNYGQLKDDLYAVAYASLVSPGEIFLPSEDNLRKADIINARRTINNNNLRTKA
ncbi:hypothetical protein GOV10_02705, partial [Candidatus Woesearchaeota archaeon]|nr:hypothetical protein [Candidatus Woesearchaeota archaeon]